MEKIKVFVVDDHEMFREGVKLMLSKSSEFEILGEAQNGVQCIENLPQNTDVILMDIAMPEMNGIEATQKILENNPNHKIIALSMFGDEEYYYKMIHSGVKGFVLKESGSKELEEAIKEVYNGGNFFSQELLRNIIVNFGDNKVTHTETIEDKISFTKRELEILNQICAGMSNKEVADALNISLRTVESHKSKLLQKTESKNTISLVMYAIKNNVITIN